MAGPGKAVIHRFMGPQKPPEIGYLERTAEKMRDLADHAAAERQHAGDEDDALDHRHPLAESGQVLLHGDDHEGADDRAEHRAEAAHQRHQHDFARHAPVHVGQRSILRHERDPVSDFGPDEIGTG